VKDKYAEVRNTLAEVFEDNHQSYVYRRLKAALGRERVFLSEKVVRRLMKQGGLQAAIPRKRRYASYVGEVSPAPENLTQLENCRLTVFSCSHKQLYHFETFFVRIHGLPPKSSPRSCAHPPIMITFVGATIGRTGFFTDVHSWFCETR